MKKVQKYPPVWILSLTFVLGLSILWLLFPKSSVPQPVYQNKPLSDWLNPQPVPASPWNYSPFDRYVLNPDGVDAVNALGEDCIPWLLHAITPKPNPWKERVLKLTEGTGFSWPSNKSGLKAILAFEVLGSRGAEAIPSLLTLLDDPKNFSKVASGVAALCAVGDQGISALTEAYEQMNSLHQRSLILGNLMANMKSDQERILVPFLVSVLKRESDTAIYLHILEILVRFKVATNDEELTKYLMAIPTGDTIDNTDGNEFLGAMSSCLALGNFAAHGNPLALTALQNFSKEGDDTVRGKISIRILEWLEAMQNEYQSSEIPHQDLINGLMNLRQNP